MAAQHATEPRNPHAREPTPHNHAWTFLTNHSHVLCCLHRDPHIRLRDVAAEVDITERAVQRIVLDLEEAGVIHRHRQGRRNVYQVLTNQPLRHPVESHRTVGDLLELVNGSREPGGEPGGHEPGGGEAEPDAGGAG